ncbi:uncharacterized protein LOC133627088 isoform X2 [Colius striatus]|uniref:uncharacterized protein LOC133627088 isoform X2 n=1 Tax=Colius striatus TaxID=57412 RepID=UPI002B1DF3BA|nr:uncharacterized protein LOC133627088 isoform X2 [Colius striatus]
MRCARQPLGVLAAVTKGLLILWAVPGQGARPLKPPTLQQIQALVRHMAEDAQELFTFYKEDQRLTINDLCHNKQPPEWLQIPGPWPEGLWQLRRTMTNMSWALQDISRHQRDLNPPGAEILRRLDRTHLKVRGLLSNLDGFLQAPRPWPDRRPPPGPTAPTRVFWQKVEGCRVLCSYACFMDKLSTREQAKSRRQRRGKRRQCRGCA